MAITKWSVFHGINPFETSASVPQILDVFETYIYGVKISEKQDVISCWHEQSLHFQETCCQWFQHADPSERFETGPTNAVLCCNIEEPKRFEELHKPLFLCTSPVDFMINIWSKIIQYRPFNLHLVRNRSPVLSSFSHNLDALDPKKAAFNSLLSWWLLYIRLASNMGIKRSSSIHLMVQAFMNGGRLTTLCYLIRVRMHQGILTKQQYMEMLSTTHPYLNHCSRHTYFFEDLDRFTPLHHSRHLASCMDAWMAKNASSTPANAQLTSDDHPYVRFPILGSGRHKKRIPCELILKYACKNTFQEVQGIHQFNFVQYIHISQVADVLNSYAHNFVCKIPVDEMTTYMNVKELRDLAKIHGISLLFSETKSTYEQKFIGHHCPSCNDYVFMFSPCNVAESDMGDQYIKSFPPDAPSKHLVESIIAGFCNDTQPLRIMESGCAVCGQLTPLSNLCELGKTSCNLDILCVENVGRRERKTMLDPILPLSGRIIDAACNHICVTCEEVMLKGALPKNALANGLWIGEIPEQLRDLSLPEQMLISRVRHNRCVVRVSSGRAKMTANAIMFDNPSVKIYHILPPPRQDLDEILAITFIGCSPPTENAFKRIPMFVRRNKVAFALEWLKLNHIDYADLEISKDNLEQYPLNGIPVYVDFKKAEADDSNRIPSAMSLHDDELEEGTTMGPCSFTVNGLVGVEFSKLSVMALKARALQHLENQGKTLGIGHGNALISMYDNPQAYPQMFPWLFPYGYGGIGQSIHKNKISEGTHKRLLLMYHDKRFQTDLYFPMIAFNHDQIKAGTTSSFLLAKRQKFKEISNRLLTIDKDILANISKRLQEGERVVPQSEKEKACYRILDDLDHVGGFVKGSLTGKKYMRNEIWSMIAYLGAPSWFITLSPADNRHPICLYFADYNVEFKPEIRGSNERNIMVAKNPVAAARFFHLMVQMFIKHVLGTDTDHRGLYGDTSAYYGTVEQQGRLTLHLHAVLWITGAFSPQKIREKIMDNDSEFQRKLIDYLEGCHMGEFLTGTMDEIKQKIPYISEKKKGIHEVYVCDGDKHFQKDDGYQDPTLTCPIPPPDRCKDDCGNCSRCINAIEWQTHYVEVVDDLILRSNVHRCSASTSQSKGTGEATGTKDPTDVYKGHKGCIGKDGICKARFPRDVFPETFIDNSDGHIFMKKREAMINTFSPSLTYVMRCNTDVSSMLSGTTMKAVVSYVTEYISKVSLKTHQIFSSAYDVFDRNSDIIESDIKPKDAARKLLLKMVNALSCKMEIGSPMACLYLLGNPDHYTSHDFVSFWWRSYVSHVQNYWTEDTLANRNEVIHSMDVDAENNEDLHKAGDKRMDVMKEENPSPGGGNEATGMDGKVGYFQDATMSLEDQVILGQNEGQYIAMSNIDDYRFRPEMLSHISLYDWIRLSVKRKKTLKERSSTNCVKISDKKSNSYFSFLSDHPQSTTHVVKCDPLRNNIIPNFIGGSLPRCDRGDREHYCCTMLTLFKPWRSARQLKNTEETWDDAFMSHVFTDRQKELMDHFNLKYECLDERDDYHAILKKKAHLKNIASFDNDVSDDDANDVEYQSQEDNNAVTYDDLGINALKKLGQMNEVERIMRSAGWFNSCLTAVQPTTQEQIFPSTRMSCSGWKAVLKGCREKILSMRMKNFKTMHSEQIKPQGCGKSSVNDVKILDANFFERDFRATIQYDRVLIEEIAQEFKLNVDQERAFRIVANHATLHTPDQLKMYLGGMGGTGKSQVIKALIAMFERRNESHRFIALAPTGTAAALLNGSTYHFALGIRSLKNEGTEEAIRNEAAIVNEVRTRLQGVDYIFIDEVSMIACHELYAISSRLSQVENVHDLPFGGKNIILAGDFAQLPPTQGKALYSNAVNNVQNHKASLRDQENIIGRILWHQVTTVVILTENMRQKMQTVEDAKLRTALTNMRYAACTKEDIEFLRTKIVGNAVHRPNLSDPKFRNVSIITAWNSQKDKINEMGCIRFAKDNNQKLVEFCSIDKRAESKVGRKKRGSKKKEKNGGSFINTNLQNILWNSHPHTSEHIAGKLSLCLGMPVIIRNNDATELCITKGQEALVVGWDSFKGPQGREVLETIFLKLINPPKMVQIPGLPLNVVPMTRASNTIKCDLPDDSEITIIRQQVQILPNFSMTDYASQGKTRPINVVDLGHCKNFQSYYTCLSRSASAENTAIIQGFSTDKITKGISGFLRQEFRELNMLNQVTKLRYEKKIPLEASNSLRSSAIRGYQLMKKGHDLDDDWHPSLRWKSNEKIMQDIELGTTWNATFMTNIPGPTLKRKRNSIADAMKGSTEEDRLDPDDEGPKFKKWNHIAQIHSPPSPLGLIWDHMNYSCAYDALYTILYHIWTERPLYVENYGENSTQYMKILIDGFKNLQQGQTSFEAIRDTVRQALFQDFPNKYAVGPNNSNLDEIIYDMTDKINHGSSKTSCGICKFSDERPFYHISAYSLIGWSSDDYQATSGKCSIQQYIDLRLGAKDRLTKLVCRNCLHLNSKRIPMTTIHALWTLPNILIFTINNWIDIDNFLTFIIHHDIKKYLLKGIIYLSEEHFTCRLIDDRERIWYHDGIKTRSSCVAEGNLSDIPHQQWLRSIDAADASMVKTAVSAIYVKQ